MLLKLLILSVMPFHRSSLRIMSVAQGGNGTRVLKNSPLLWSTCTGGKNIYFITGNFKATKLLQTFCSVIYKSQQKILCKVDSKAHTTSPGSANMVFLRQMTKWTRLCLFQWCEITSGSQVALTPPWLTLNYTYVFKHWKDHVKLIMEGKIKQSTCPENNLGKIKCKN